MRNNADKKKFLEALEETPWIIIAAKRVGISRATIYRWIESTPRFRMAIEKVQERGRQGETDLAHGKLHQLIVKGDFRAIKFLLENHDPRYMKSSGETSVDAQMKEATETLKNLLEEVKRVEKTKDD